MLAPPLGAYLMRSSLWAPIIIGFVCLLLAVALTVVIPETRFTALATGEPQEDGPACDPAGPSESEERKVDSGLKGRVDAAVRHTLSTVGFVLKHRNLVLLMAVFFSTDFAQQSPTILLRYVSSRYSVSLAKVYNHISTFSLLCVHLCCDHDADARTVRYLGQLPVLLPGVWTNAGIWHRPPSPRHHTDRPIRTLAPH